MSKKPRWTQDKEDGYWYKQIKDYFIWVRVEKLPETLELPITMEFWKEYEKTENLEWSITIGRHCDPTDKGTECAFVGNIKEAKAKAEQMFIDRVKKDYAEYTVF